ncbi:MAG: hypothetical protein KJ063_09390 [Anaerolineae bacterium]|nr:hypothetical protein [Anaerolineae bacterium]
MILTEWLQTKREEIVGAAATSLHRSHLPHYDQAGPQESQERLARLYDLLRQSIEQRSLAAIVSHAERIAQERFAAGYDLLELQTAFNVLEEAIWHTLIQECPPEELAEAIGLVSTVQGAAKDALARQYVSLASQTKVTTLNLGALFGGKG